MADFAPAERIQLDQQSSTSSRYRHRLILGEGGMGLVRLAHDRRLGRDVAVKTLKSAPAKGGRRMDRERFLREAWVQGQLDHPSIVPIYDVDRNDAGDVFFTMKRIAGETLDRILSGLRHNVSSREPKYSRRKLLTAFANVCMAIHYAHMRGVCHRDIKPANIMLGEFGEVYILDWGVAKVDRGADPSDLDSVFPQGDPPQTLHGALLGTPGYMAPEQALGQVDRQGPQSDVYSLGAILFELMVLEPLHQGATSRALWQSTLNGAEYRSSVRAPLQDVPPEIEALWTLALEPDPTKRTLSAREMSQGIERYLDSALDMERRRDLALAHVARARDAAKRVVADPQREDDRKLAMQEVGRAIVLEPGNQQALKVFAELVAKPPATLPEEVEREIEQCEEDDLSRGLAIVSKVTIVGTLATIPLSLVGGIENWGFIAVFMSILTALWGYTHWIMKLPHKVRSSAKVLSVSVILCCLLAGVSCAFGAPFSGISVGIVLTAVVIVTNLCPPKLHGLLPVVVLGGLTSIAAPMVLEAWGVFPRTTDFRSPSELVIHSVVVKFHEWWSPVVFLGAVLVMLTLAVSFVAYAKREAARARREQHLTSWQLRQLIPEVCNLPTRGSSSPPPRLGLLSVQRIMVKVIR